MQLLGLYEFRAVTNHVECMGMLGVPTGYARFAEIKCLRIYHSGGTKGRTSLRWAKERERSRWWGWGWGWGRGSMSLHSSPCFTFRIDPYLTYLSVKHIFSMLRKPTRRILIRQDLKTMSLFWRKKNGWSSNKRDWLVPILFTNDISTKGLCINIKKK